MGLSTSMELAMAGLRTTQAGLDVVSQNVANSGTVGYTRRTLVSSQQVSDGRTTGVTITGSQRMLDTLLQRQLRLENAGATYTSKLSAAHKVLDGMFDAPGGSGSLPTLLNGFTTSLTSLANDPSSYAKRATVLSAAGDLASSLNSLSGQVQSLRQDSENGLAADVKNADRILQQIQKLNTTMSGSPGNAGSAALQDQRDALVDQLSSLMDIKVAENGNGSISIATTGGLRLFDGLTATRLAFDPHSPIGPSSTYDSDPTRRTVGTITATDASGATTDVIAGGLVRSGSIAAGISLRDKVLPQAQAQLDALAAGLASSLSDTSIAGTPASSGGASGFDLDIAGLSSGNTVTLDTKTTPAGTAQRFTFVKVEDSSQLPLAQDAVPGGGRTIGISFAGGAASVASQIATALGGGFSVSSPGGTTLRILDDGAAGTTDVTGLSATKSATSLAGGTAELPFFVDPGRTGAPYTGSFDHGAELTGFAGRIALNAGLASDPSKLVQFASTTPAGDTTRPTLLIDRLTAATRSFSGSAGIGGSSAPYAGSVVDFASRIVETQALDANSAANLDSGQQVVLNSIQGRYSETAGVNIDTEMAQLIQLQTAYGANARLLTAVKDMMDMLLRVGA